ncbi:glycosyltransferase family 4 protein [Novosphingobium sp.]|uniref:glycosyltransferase family 4 protein n=1 Tax=Novosphingobium sp. TaxID=1874826 RepID=UPI00262D918C|nr:glycosyltransferase family 4 protein [Novosphingobium sp.]
MTIRQYTAMAPGAPLASVPRADRPAELHSILTRPAYGLHAAMRVAVVGTYAPRSCGIATFTADLCEQLASHFPEVGLDVYALEAPGRQHVYADDIALIAAETPGSYAEAARAINASGTDVVWIQHEFGIFGGKDGQLITELVDRVAAPMIVTFHTVLASPSEGQRAVMEHLVQRCSRIMVMSQQSREILVSVYRARREIVDVIEHGAPDRPFGKAEAAKQRMGLEGRKVLTTFGLLSPGKGIDVAIAAMPAILAQHPDAIYRIIGATHPVTAAREGESYRAMLEDLAQRLGVAESIQWDNRFLAIDELLGQLECCDIYLTPYRSLGQTTSGTLSYAVALGKAVVSTPYVHARELLADDVGCLIEPESPEAIAEAVTALLSSPPRLLAMQERAYERGRRTIWTSFARASMQLLRRTQAPRARPASTAVDPALTAVWHMSEATGMHQHGIGAIPDFRHGYCIDDNARALMLMNVAGALTEAERHRWSVTYAAFVQYAWNPDLNRFRNFMAYDRSWCEDMGSQDSNGRGFWSLGHTVENSPFKALRSWAENLFDHAATALEALDTPRSMAFGALGACALLRAGANSAAAERRIAATCDALAGLVSRHQRPGWTWFELMLAYDNPRLSQALIECGVLLGRQDWLDTGLETLRWLAEVQTAAAGHFRPVGSETFGSNGTSLPFDQQPLEAQAAIEAARAAWHATRDPFWLRHAERAYQWFLGGNDRGVVLADPASGSCCDGVTPRGRNENCGAESILAYQIGHYSLKALQRSADQRLPPDQCLPAHLDSTAALA